MADLLTAGECLQGVNASKEIKVPPSAVRPVLLKILTRARHSRRGFQGATWRTGAGVDPAVTAPEQHNVQQVKETGWGS